MRKTLSRRAGAVLAAVIMTAALGLTASGATAQTVLDECGSAWESTAVYHGGDQVSHNGRQYEAKWWTQGEEPGTTGEWGVWLDLGSCSDEPDDPDDPDDPGDPGEPPGDHYNIGYFTEWGVYDRNYHAKNIVDSGSAEKLTHIVYAFGNVQGGQCTMGDNYAATQRTYSAAESVDGEGDNWNDPLRGNFNQLLKLKEMYPHLEILWSFGGWTWSDGFGQAAQNPQAFADACYDLVHDSQWSGLFDGIDIDWEYPNACGKTCDSSGPNAFGDLMSALRNRFGSDELVTAAVTADATEGGKIDATDYGAAAQYVDFYMVMTYDYFGAWNDDVAPHSPLQAYPDVPIGEFNASASIAKYKSLGVPADKLLLGIGFYGRGWNATQAGEGEGNGPAPGTYEQGIEDYKVISERCPTTGQMGGTAFAQCGNEWWGYDTPETIADKMDYLHSESLAGAFFWELSGDTASGELITAIHDNLQA
ncbi:glycosyl hydrolase family 18 protein [Haloglycomyces albus]|uniref:glycosyl hydrolase family 18 protein n=1 Tax=Haloglycomyces albus TaxID=526067 RepID=UPI00046CA059|nr:glycosyl hydrolase family 18 protein [Haloglycomyces albus]